MDWLYANRKVESLGGGISAMPSLHVAIACLVFFTVRSRLRQRWAVWAAGLYAFSIWFASVHLAWHYAVDGLFSFFGVALIWWGTGRFVESLDSPRKADPGETLSGAPVLGPSIAIEARKRREACGGA